MDNEDREKLFEILKCLIPFIVKEFIQGGKTKLGLYVLIGAWSISKFVFGFDIPVQGAEMEAARSLPVAAGVSVGAILTAVGLVHDLYKKQKSIRAKLSNLSK